MTGHDADLISVVRAHFQASLPSKIGIAVSGGGDSVALLHLMSKCFADSGVALYAATVDHQLRPESKDEAAEAGAHSAKLNIPHSTLVWSSWDGKGNLQAAARQARYELLSQWAHREGIPVVAVGHTADDQAETLIMRLRRSPGVDGLAGMAPRSSMFGMSVHRPLLSVTRDRLRAYLRDNGIDWRDDPSNENTRFDRVQARRAQSRLSELGVTVDSLVSVAEHMREAREALDWYAFLTARDLITIDLGDIVMDLRRFRTQPQEIARRLLTRAVTWIGGATYAPRRSAVSEAIEALRFGRGATLGGCQIIVSGSQVWICREYATVQSLTAMPGEVWDKRWRLIGPVGDADTRICALGPEGLKALPDWRKSGRPRAALLASPAVWRKDELLAAPLAEYSNGWRAGLQESDGAFFATLISN